MQVANEYGMLKAPQFHYTWDSTWSNSHLAGPQVFAVVPFLTTAKQKIRKAPFHIAFHISQLISHFSFKIHIIHWSGRLNERLKRKGRLSGWCNLGCRVGQDRSPSQCAKEIVWLSCARAGRKKRGTFTVQISQHRHYIWGPNHKIASTTYYPLCASGERIL